MKASHYFLAAILTLFLGALTWPTALAAIALWSAGGNLAVGVYGAFLIVVATTAPIIYFAAGLVRLWLGPG